MNGTPTSNRTQADEMSVEAYIAAQPRYARRRAILRGAIRLIIMRLLCRVTVIGAENIPDTGGAILMMNHISLLDPILCVGAVMNRFVVPMSKIENLRTPVIGTVIRWYGGFTVNRGEIDRKALQNSIALVQSGQLILIAPEGTRQKHGLTEAKDGLAYVATKSDAIIIPAGVYGALNWIDDLKHLRRPNITLTFGRPFRFKTEGKRVSREALRAMSREAMVQLALTLPDAESRGEYADIEHATTEHLMFLS
jgi:1-acyl-sn-glycerol-3-phosphate acyltransferase